MPTVNVFNHRIGLVGKEQADYDTPETLSNSADGFDLYVGDGEPPPPEAIDAVFNGMATSGRGAGSLFPRLQMPPQGFFRGGSYDFRVKGLGATYSGSAFPPNEIHRVLKACGLTATFGSSAWTYAVTAADTNPTVLTFRDYRQQDMVELSNVQGTFTLKSSGLGAVILSWNYMGVVTAQPATTAYPSITLSQHSVQPPPAVGITCTVGGTAMRVREFTFTQNRTFDTARPLLTASGGHAGFVGAGMAPTLELVCERLTRSTYDPDADWRAGTSRAVVLTVGASATNKFTLNMPTAQVIESPKAGNEGGLATVSMVLGAKASTPQLTDGFTLVFD